MSPNASYNTVIFVKNHNKLKLTLWGKVNVIKMVVTPQFNYVLMMLPITVSPQIFKQYDTIIK